MRKYKAAGWKSRQKIKSQIESGRIAHSPDFWDMGAVLLFVLLIPYIISFFFGNVESEYVKDRNETTGFMVCNTTAAGTERMPMETYLMLRLPATIDMNYEPEVLKAQAVILRTELMKAYEEGTEKEEQYIYMRSNILSADGEEYEKSRKAVEETKGMYMAYNGSPIRAPYFAVSAGKTRNGNEAFRSEEYPYLKSVMCERDFMADGYIQTIQINEAVFWVKLKELYPEFTREAGKGIEELLQIERDKSGYVTELTFGNMMVSGEAFRQAFSLNSAHFTLEEENNTFINDTIVIKTKGIGHGVGFSQYGANEAAKKGSDFIDILNYFFTDIVMEKTE